VTGQLLDPELLAAFEPPESPPDEDDDEVLDEPDEPDEPDESALPDPLDDSDLADALPCDFDSDFPLGFELE
jgi:hypothetical protein